MVGNDVWFAVSRFPDVPVDDVRRRKVAGAAALWVHAKKLGTISSACGEDTSSWHKHWQYFQSMRGVARCHLCAEIVEENEGAR